MSYALAHVYSYLSMVFSYYSLGVSLEKQQQTLLLSKHIYKHSSLTARIRKRGKTKFGSIQRIEKSVEVIDCVPRCNGNYVCLLYLIVVGLI